MLRRRSIERGLGSVAVAACLVATACTDDGVALHIECNIAPEVTETACTWNPDGMDCVFDGRMNLRAAQSYYAGFRVRSGLKSRQALSPPRSEPNGIQLQEAEVELRTPGGSPLSFKGLDLANPYTLVSSGYVSPSGVGLLQVELIPAAYARALRDQEKDPKRQIGQVVAVVKARGITDGQTKVETASFYWPIRLTYVNPVAFKGECVLSDTGVCSTLVGTDASADICLCGIEPGSKDSSCDLDGQ